MDTRSHILEQALQLFAARGYDGVGVQEICVAAGVTKPTLYHYFGSKSGLVTALLDERAAPLLAELGAATTYNGDLPLSLERVGRAYFTFAANEPTLYRLLLMLWFGVPAGEAFAVILAHNLAQQRLVEALFAQAAHDHGNMTGRQRIYAATFIGTLNTYISMAGAGTLILDDAALHQVVRQFSYGIYS